MAFRRRTVRHRNSKTTPRRAEKAIKVCEDTGKRRFAKAEALKALDERKMGTWKGVDSERPKREERIYRCPFCKGWHLTSQQLRS